MAAVAGVYIGSDIAGYPPTEGNGFRHFRIAAQRELRELRELVRYRTRVIREHGQALQ